MFFLVLQYSFESLFRSMHFTLLDNSCREYLFLADFFMVEKNAKDLFTAVFGKTLSLFLVSLMGVVKCRSTLNACKYNETVCSRSPSNITLPLSESVSLPEQSHGLHITLPSSPQSYPQPLSSISIRAEYSPIPELSLLRSI